MNRRVVRWPLQNGKNGETIISNIDCHGLTMADNGLLYVTDYKKDEVRRYQVGQPYGDRCCRWKRKRKRA